MTRYSDFLQKLSSAATPPGGRQVSSMDEIVDRELSGRCLDESTIRQSSTFTNLIHRLFPSPSEVTPEELNKKYLDLLEKRKAARKLKLARAPHPRYNFRARKPRPVPQALPATSQETQSDEEEVEELLYDTRKRRWKVDVFQPGEEALALERAILEPTNHSCPPTGPVLDGPMPLEWNQVPSQDAAATDTVTANTDPANGNGDYTSSFEDASRKGHGDSFRDKDYCDPDARKRDQEKKASITSEIQWATFLNAVADSLSGFPEGSPRMWTGSFSSRRLPSESGQIQWNRKPDLVLIADRCGSNGTITWRHPKALGEVTITDLQRNTTLTKSLMTKAYILLSSQPWRRYALAFSIAEDQLRVYLFDRSGVIVSPPINIHKRVEETCRIIHAFANADDTTLGFDPTLRIHSPPRPSPSSIGTVEVDGIDYDIISILWTSNGFIGRCTNAFHVRRQGAPPHIIKGRLDEYDYVVKDSWLDEKLAGHEEKIFEHISGTKGVPKLIKAWTVQNAGDDDTTLRHRPTVWDRRMSPQYVTRVHRRLLITPVGNPLSSFRSQREFLGGLIEALEIHERLVTEKDILHRDISPNNIIFVPSEDGGDRSVVLIDFDYAAELDGRSAPYPKGTGTLPFVSMEILREVTLRVDYTADNNEITHEVADDLESFFYVFTWICILYDGPNNSLTTPADNNTSILHGWAEAAMEKGGMMNALNAKNAFIHGPQANEIIRTQFTPYFKNMRPLALEWRALVKAEDDRRVSVHDSKMEPEFHKHQPQRQPLTHKVVIMLLRHHLENLPH